MILRNEEMNNIELMRKIGEGTTSVCYRTNDSRVLKKYKLTENYKHLLELHGYKYLEFLDRLSKEKCNNLVVPEDIFATNKGTVSGYTYPYEYGNLIAELYPKTDLDKLRDALYLLYLDLEEMDYLRLGDMHEGNIIYTGDIKLIDLDMSTYSSANDIVTHNIGMVNRALYHALIKNPRTMSDKTASLFRDMNMGNISFVEFFDSFREDMSNLNNRDTKYIRDLLPRKRRG